LSIERQDATVMHIRCGNCHETIPVQETGFADCPSVVACASCSQEYDLGPRLAKTDVDRFFKDAQELARTRRIALPDSCSVLLGIMKLEHLGDICESEAQPSDTGSASTARYDYSFRPAVEAGWLTAAQASMRGKRALFATRLMERHGLSKERALEVADNRKSLAEAVRTAASTPPPAPMLELTHRPRRRSVWPYLLTAVVGVAGVVTVVAILNDGATEEPVPRSTVTVRAPMVIASLADISPEVRRNDSGEVVEIAGGNPRAILDTFCRTLTRGTVDPVAIEPTGQDWTGLYRQDGRLLGIAIRRDTERELWVAGNAVDRLYGEPITTP
jgi:hypothetical protein